VGADVISSTAPGCRDGDFTPRVGGCRIITLNDRKPPEFLQSLKAATGQERPGYLAAVGVAHFRARNRRDRGQLSDNIAAPYVGAAVLVRPALTCCSDGRLSDTSCWRAPWLAADRQSPDGRQVAAAIGLG